MLTKRLECQDCRSTQTACHMLFACPRCGGRLVYRLEGPPPARCDVVPRSMWDHFEWLPLEHRSHIVSLGEGASEIIELPELSDSLNRAKLFVKLDCFSNPTGTFKDREASLVISRCKALGLDNLVFYSTGNTGRSYTHYAAYAGLSSNLIVPAQCLYKQTRPTLKTAANTLICVDDEYPTIASYAKRFAAANTLTLIAPLHERTEAYATVAYEQVLQMPDCDVFAQTIASGMGPVGFFRGHQHLIRLGLRQPSQMPRIVCIQSSETAAMSQAYRAGQHAMTPDDLPRTFPERLYEPTLNSTNPVNNYPDLRECLDGTGGSITDVDPQFVTREGSRFVAALRERGYDLQVEIEKSLLIGYAGLVRLADEKQIHAGERVLLLGTGRGGPCGEAIEPDLVIRPSIDDPEEVFRRLARTVALG